MRLLDLAIRQRWATLIERSYHVPPSELSEQDEDGLTVLHLACIDHQPVDIIRVLLVNNVMVQRGEGEEVVVIPAARCVDAGGMSPLHCICSFDFDDHDDGENDYHHGGGGGGGRRREQVKVVKELVKSYPDVIMMKDSWGWTPLHFLCARMGGGSSSFGSGGMNQQHQLLHEDENSSFFQHHHNNGDDDNDDNEEKQVSPNLKVAQILITTNPNVIHVLDNQAHTPLDLLCQKGGYLDQLFLEQEQRKSLMSCHYAISHGGSLRDLWCIVELLIQYHHYCHCCYSSSFPCCDETFDKDTHINVNDKKKKKSCLQLHQVSSMMNKCSNEIVYLMTLIYPQQAQMKNAGGYLPLHLAILQQQQRCGYSNDNPNGDITTTLQNKHDNNNQYDGIYYILNMSPPGILETCSILNMHYPYLLSRIGSYNENKDQTECTTKRRRMKISSLTLLFQMLTSKPELMGG
mmetsp:Transcript_22289/g.33303  ORF Transcript_22289/g.33303 Transcript_22289/m.33303 type:complete len:461 (+) Transcript_22289:323-1705(+)